MATGGELTFPVPRQEISSADVLTQRKPWPRQDKVQSNPQSGSASPAGKLSPRVREAPQHVDSVGPRGTLAPVFVGLPR